LKNKIDSGVNIRPENWQYFSHSMFYGKPKVLINPANMEVKTALYSPNFQLNFLFLQTYGNLHYPKSLFALALMLALKFFQHKLQKAHYCNSPQMPMAHRLSHHLEPQLC